MSDLKVRTKRELAADLTRMLKGKNKSAVAREIGVAIPTVWSWLRGEHVPDVLTYEKIVRISQEESACASK